MKSKIFAAFAAASLSLASLPASAWEYGEVSGLMYYAFQRDSTGLYALVIDCEAGFGEYTIAIETQEAWEETTSYAPEVPVKFTIDGTQFSTDSFRFVNRGGFLAVELYEYADTDAFSTLDSAIYQAERQIAVSYFDKSLTFATDDVVSAIDAVELTCM